MQSPKIRVNGITAARLVLPRAWFDRVKCSDGLEALRQYRSEFDERTRTFRDRPRHDWASHSADAFRATAIGYRAMTAAESEADDDLKEKPRAASNPGSSAG